MFIIRRRAVSPSPATTNANINAPTDTSTANAVAVANGNEIANRIINYTTASNLSSPNTPGMHSTQMRSFIRVKLIFIKCGLLSTHTHAYMYTRIRTRIRAHMHTRIRRYTLIHAHTRLRTPNIYLSYLLAFANELCIIHHDNSYAREICSNDLYCCFFFFSECRCYTTIKAHAATWNKPRGVYFCCRYDFMCIDS